MRSTKDNTVVLLLAEALLGVYALIPYSDPSGKLVALGALVGVVGGHLNGSRNAPVSA